MIFVVAYDLKTPNDTSSDYQRVMNGIKSNCNSWCHLEKSVFLVDAITTSVALRETLKPFLYSGDSLFVCILTGSWASYGIGDERSNWLKNRDF
jgi:hypothetical protein